MKKQAYIKPAISSIELHMHQSLLQNSFKLNNTSGKYTNQSMFTDDDEDDEDE